MHLTPAAELATEPLDVGPDHKLHLVDVIDRTQGELLCAGICEAPPGTPVDFDDDGDAVARYMLDGEMKLSENGESRTFKPGDVVYSSQQQSLLVYWSTDSYGRFFYVTYPHWR